MPTRTAGDAVVDFTFKGVDGKTYSTAETRKNGLLMLVFYKVTCPVCQFNNPYMEKFRAYEGKGFQIWGVSQDDAQKTVEYARTYGNVTFPQVLDEELKATVAYDLVSVPTLYLLDSGDTILWQTMGWNRDELNKVSQMIAERLGVPAVKIVEDDDPAPVFRPG
ncbi:MAG: TlpA family protein disulfide reductase [Chthonomonadetes bacterium]|nr:TlpA family protein disulfide reductase [Chthonomonadetes bacterium]